MKGVEEFNKAFVTEEFERNTEAESKRLTDNIVWAGRNDPGSDDVRHAWAAERAALDGMLERLRRGEEVSLLLGGKKQMQRGFQYGQIPVEDAITINIKRQSVPSVEPQA